MSSELSLNDFYPDRQVEATQKSVATQNCEQKLTPAKIEHERKLDKFITLLFHDELNMTDACTKMEISRTTGYEWYNEWKRQQEPQKIDQTFWRLMNIVEADNPEKALDCATRIKIKLTDATVNVNQKTEITERISIHKEIEEIIKFSIEAEKK